MEVSQAIWCCKDCNPALTDHMLRGEVTKMTLISVVVQVVMVATNTFPMAMALAHWGTPDCNQIVTADLTCLVCLSILLLLAHSSVYQG